MGLDVETSIKPHERLADHLKDDLAAVNDLIRQRMAANHAPRIPEVTAFTPQPYFLMTASMKARSGAGGPRQTFCGTTNRRFWWAIICLHVRSS